jgi:nucleotide-binding universal stress UspA family protein
MSIGSAVVAALDSRPTMDTVMLATDLSSTSAQATDRAIELSSRMNARLVVINVIDERRTGGGPGRHERLDQIRSRREEAMLALTAAARRAGARGDFLIWDGDVGRSIVAAAQGEGAGLIVVGSRALDRAGRFLLGSVSDYVVHHAHCPVMVVRPMAAGAEQPVGSARSDPEVT